MTEAVIVSTARTPIGKAFRGAFNMTHGATLGGHVVKHAVERAGIDPAEVEKIIVDASVRMGVKRRNVSKEEIIERLIYPMVNEGARILEEGIATRSGDIDEIGRAHV